MREDLTDRPFDERRARLERLGEGFADPLFVTRTTLDVDLAREWFTTFEGAGLDGVVAKPRARPYEPGKRTMLKVKHHRTADVVAELPSVVYRLSADRLRDLEINDRPVAIAVHKLMSRVLAERLADVTNALEAALR